MDICPVKEAATRPVEVTHEEWGKVLEAVTTAVIVEKGRAVFLWNEKRTRAVLSALGLRLPKGE
jgi:hypothetical protein